MHDLTPSSPTHIKADSTSPDALSLFDILFLLSKRLKLIAVFVFAFAILGFIFAVTADPIYKSSSIVLCDDEDSNSAGLGSLSPLQSLGINLLSGTSGLGIDTYPDILMSREVRLAVARDTFFFEELGEKTSFTRYATRANLMSTIKKYTIYLPGRILASLSGTAPQPASSPTSTPSASAPPSRQEESAMKALTYVVETDIQRDKGIFSITTSANSASLAAAINQSFLDYFADRVQNLRTQKKQQNVDFIEAQFSEATQELLEAENELATFNDKNIFTRGAQLTTQKNRLERQVQIKTQLYGELQTQLVQEQIELERSRPLITIIDSPAAPIDPDGPSRLMMIISSTLFGGMLAIGLVLTEALIQKIRVQESNQQISELELLLTPLQKITAFIASLSPIQRKSKAK